MAARATFKGVVRFGEAAVPVKLYSALEDRSVRFRLLHEGDLVPIEQVLVSSDSGEVVEYAAARRAFETREGALVMLDDDDLAQIEPEPSREITVNRFVPREAIDHRHYLRPYYLGPDGDEPSYHGLVAAIGRTGRQGLASWTMRKKRYLGALRLYRNSPMLVTLKSAHEVISAEELSAPKGPALDKRELAMARQLIGMLAAPFESEAYRDDYRHRVLELIERKKRGRKIEVPERTSEKPPEDLLAALEASLRREREHAAR